MCFDIWATVAVFLKFMSIFSKFIHFSKAFKFSYALAFGSLRLSCVFLANYVPKCQMNSGPHGPILSITPHLLFIVHEQNVSNYTITQNDMGQVLYEWVFRSITSCAFNRCYKLDITKDRHSKFHNCLTLL